MRELAALVPIAILCLVIGVRPQPVLDVMEPELEAIASLYAIESQPSSAVALDLPVIKTSHAEIR